MIIIVIAQPTLHKFLQNKPREVFILGESNKNFYSTNPRRAFDGLIPTVLFVGIIGAEYYEDN